MADLGSASRPGPRREPGFVKLTSVINKAPLSVNASSQARLPRFPRPSHGLFTRLSRAYHALITRHYRLQRPLAEWHCDGDASARSREGAASLGCPCREIRGNARLCDCCGRATSLRLWSCGSYVLRSLASAISTSPGHETSFRRS
jgi:hypothetical protein